MLRISKKADYAVFLLGCIAREGAHPGGTQADSVVSAQEIARQSGLNKSVVANLLKEFARHGLLESVRGLRGGYRLAQRPGEISLAAILRVIDGPFHLVECIRHLEEAPAPAAAGGPAGADAEHACSLMSFCPTRNPMRVVHERIAQLFQRITLDELCGLSPAPALSLTSSPTGSHR